MVSPSHKSVVSLPMREQAVFTPVQRAQQGAGMQLVTACRAIGQFVVHRCQLISVAAFFCFGMVSQAGAGVILTDQGADDLRVVERASSASPSTDADNHADKHNVQDASAAQQTGLPMSTGVSHGGASVTVSVAAALGAPCEVHPTAALPSSLEERRVSLPDSPVLERLRPPCGPVCWR